MATATKTKTNTTKKAQAAIHQKLSSTTAEPRLDLFEKMFRSYMNGTRQRESARSIFGLDKHQAATIREHVRTELGRLQPKKQRATKTTKPVAASKVFDAATIESTMTFATLDTDKDLLREAVRSLVRERKAGLDHATARWNEVAGLAKRCGLKL
jgi:hypothetical protein